MHVIDTVNVIYYVMQDEDLFYGMIITFLVIL